MDVKSQAKKLAQPYDKNKLTCEQWRKALKKYRGKKPSLHPSMPTIIIQVKHGKRN